ncbi:hypothetical protein ACFL1N_13320 [Thermodesulfobacteriota bacterium]
MSRMFIRSIILSGALALSFACQTKHEVTVAPVEVKPIHITIDVNVRIDKELDDFFGDIDEVEDELEKPTSE